MSLVWVVVRKEWEEIFRTRMVLFTLLLTPMILVVVALGTMFPLAGAAADPEAARGIQELRQLATGICDGLADQDCGPVYLASVLMMMFLILPTALPSVIASYSVVGEKAARTLEPLLATPLTTGQLLVGKALSALIPATLATWGAAGLFLAAVAGLFRSEVIGALLGPGWVIALGVLVPALALLSVLVAMMVSSRSTDPRSAQQVASLVVVPVVGMLIAQSFGVMVVRPGLMIGGTVSVLVIDAGLGWLAVRMFQRETILTRWTGL